VSQRACFKGVYEQINYYHYYYYYYFYPPPTSQYNVRHNMGEARLLSLGTTKGGGQGIGVGKAAWLNV